LKFFVLLPRDPFVDDLTSTVRGKCSGYRGTRDRKFPCIVALGPLYEQRN